MTKQEFINASREFIASGKTDKALTFMRTEVGNFDPDLVKDIILLENRYTKSTADFNTGELSRENYEPIVAQITLALLEFLEKIEKSAPLSTGTVKNKNSGRILHNIPGMMPIGVERKCIVRIAYDDETLLRDMQADENTTIQSVRIAEVMGVELIDDNEIPAFSIRTITEEEQSIVSDDYTQWLFKVKALREGRFPLTLKVAVIEEVNGKERKRDIVLEKEVFIISQIEPAPAPAASSPVKVKDIPQQAAQMGFEDSTIRINYVVSEENRAVASSSPASKRFSFSGIASTIAVIAVALTGWVAFQTFNAPKNVDLPTPTTTEGKNGSNKGNTNGHSEGDTSAILQKTTLTDDPMKSQLAESDNKNNPSTNPNGNEDNSPVNNPNSQASYKPKPNPNSPTNSSTGTSGNVVQANKNKQVISGKGDGTTTSPNGEKPKIKAVPKPKTPNVPKATGGKKPSKPNNPPPKTGTEISIQPTPEPPTEEKIKIGDIKIGTPTGNVTPNIEPEAEVKTFKVYLILKGEMKKAQISVDGQPVDQYLKKNFWGSRQYIEFKSSKTKHTITFKNGFVSCSVTDVVIENGNMTVEPCSF